MTKVVLYTRVSTDEQAEKGYSLPEQMRELRENAAREGFEVAEEVVDAGYSRSTLNRPGMDRVRELVAAGGVDAVLAWKRDRYGAAPWPGVLEVEFAANGCSLRSLDDSGEGEDADFMDGIKDLIARRELRVMSQRAGMGKRSKAREGKVLGSGPAPLGFKYITDRTNYEVDEETMPIVRRIFRAVGAEGSSMWAAGRALEEDGVMAPSGGRWQVSVIRYMIDNDCYQPHTYEEVAALVSPTVAAGLDKKASYGLWYFGKERVTGAAKGRRTHRKQPREEWIAVPIPNAGIPREWVDRARESVKDNVRPPSGGKKTYELAGGIAHCGECGRKMTTHQLGKQKNYFYYVCSSARKGKGWGCDSPHHRAEVLEEAVVEAVDGELLADPDKLAAHADAAIERERATMRGPADAGKTWGEKIAECERKRAKNQEMFRADAMTLEELKSANVALDEERRAAEEGLRATARAGERVAEMEEAKRAALEMFGVGIMGGIQWFPPSLRRGVYALLGLKVVVFADRTFQVEGRFDADLMRLTPEVREYVAELREAEERLLAEERENPATGYTVEVPDPEGNPTALRVSAHAERVERLERELAALRRRLICRGAPTSECW